MDLMREQAVALSAATDAKLAALKEQSSLSLLASLWATVEAKGLQRSTVIQRIIEKYTPGRAMTAEEMANVEEEINKLTDLDGYEKPRREDGFQENYDFDIERSKDPKDLV